MKTREIELHPQILLIDIHSIINRNGETCAFNLGINTHALMKTIIKS